MWDITLAIVAVVFVLLFLWRKRRFSVLKNLGIPGPKPNIIFGNLLQLVSKTPIACHKEWLQKYGKVVGYYFGTHPQVLITDLELLKKVQISDFHKFANRPTIARRNFQANVKIEGFSQQLVVLKDKRWKEIRSIITPSFTASKMRQMAPIINGAIDSLLCNVEKKSKSGEEFDIYPMYQGLTMDVIGRTAFGIQTDVQNNPNDPFLRSAKVLFSGDISNPFIILAVSIRSLESLFRWMNKVHMFLKNKGVNPIKELIDSVKGVIALRRRDTASRRTDILQLMMDAQISESEFSNLTSDDLTAKEKDTEEQNKTTTSAAMTGKMNRKMTDADILDNSVLFFLAGYETTSTALAFTTHFLLHYPEVQDKIREEIQQLIQTKGELDYSSVNELQYLDQVLHESLRLLPPIYLFVNREASEDVDLGKFKIKKGMSIQVPVYNLHRDPTLWEDPESFKPERFSPENRKKHNPLAFQPFGGGPRNCVGMRFALMEAKLALARLLIKYKFDACSKTDKKEITLKISPATINPAKGIYMRAIAV